MPSICTNDAVNLYYEEAETGTPIHGRVGRACASEPARCPGGRREYRALDRESGGGGLLRCRWKRRQFGDVPRIVLNYHRTSPLSGFPAGPLAPLLPTRRWPPCMRRRTGTGTQLFSLQVRLHLRCSRANGTDSGDKLRFRAPEFRRPIADLMVFAHVDASGICRDLLRLVVCHTFSFAVGLAARSPCDARSDCGLRRCRPSPS